MDENIIDNNVAVLAMLDNQYETSTSVTMPHKSNLDMVDYCIQNNSGQKVVTIKPAIDGNNTCAIEITHNHKSDIDPIVDYCLQNSPQKSITNKSTEGTKNSKISGIIWNKNATLMLLSFYETKIHMIDNPKKKSKIWMSLSEELKALNIEVTPDQVRWKINAMTKKYKDCVDNGQGAESFKYFNEMHHILGQWSGGNYTLASGATQEDVIKNKKTTSKAPLRSLRAERRSKVDLDKQWIEYLKRQDEQRKIREERYERNLRLKEEELQLRKQELELKQTLALKKFKLRERKHEELLKIEKEKCALLRKLLADQ